LFYLCELHFFFLTILSPPTSTLFPYTTLFRSGRSSWPASLQVFPWGLPRRSPETGTTLDSSRQSGNRPDAARAAGDDQSADRAAEQRGDGFHGSRAHRADL